MSSLKEWIIYEWHCGRDSIIDYSGEKFNISIMDLDKIVYHMYSKQFGEKSRIRFDKQELPNEQLIDLMEQKLLH